MHVLIKPLAMDLLASRICELVECGFDSREASETFFSEEKKQKTFGSAVAEPPSARTRRTKSFLVLFFKKEPLA